jgi:hypothetical protein
MATNDHTTTADEQITIDDPSDAIGETIYCFETVHPCMEIVGSAEASEVPDSEAHWRDIDRSFDETEPAYRLKGVVSDEIDWIHSECLAELINEGSATVVDQDVFEESDEILLALAVRGIDAVGRGIDTPLLGEHDPLRKYTEGDLRAVVSKWTVEDEEGSL